MEIETWDIDRVIPYKNNARVHDEKSIKAIKASIERFSWTQPICVDKNGVIIAGHGRLISAKELGMEQVPVLVADWLTDNEVAAAREADNMTQDLSFFDWDKLNINLEEIDWLDIDMSEFGFKLDDELDSLEAEEDDYTEEQANSAPTRVQRGEIWQLGTHRLMCGDSTSETDVEMLMQCAKANMIFTDPPYNVDYSSKNAYLNAVAPGNRIQVPIENDSFETDEEIGEKLWKPAFKNMREHAEDDCSIYVTMPQGGAHMMMMMMCAASWQVKHELIWVKNNHVLGRADYNYKHEPILFGWADRHKFYGNGEFLKSVWEIPKPQKSGFIVGCKSLQLINNCLLNSSQNGDTVLDLFGGSGSTLIACEQLNRKCYMMELDPHYCDVIIDRWEKLTCKEAMRISE